MSVEDLKFVEEVMAAMEHLLVANIQYDHELRRAVGPEDERSVTRRRILEYRARKLESLILMATTGKKIISFDGKRFV